MARPQVDLNLGQLARRPIASPVDTYYQVNDVPPAEAVDQSWMQVAKSLRGLSSSVDGYMRELEKKTREKMPQEAEAAVGSFTGDLELLRSLPSMSPEEAEQFLEDNKDAFGSYPLDYRSRPDFILSFQTFAGHRFGKEGKWATDANGQPASLRDALWSRVDEFADPNTDIDALMKEVREEAFEGIDMSRGQQWRLGLLDAVAPVEREFRQVVAHQQQKNRGEIMADSVIGEIHESFEQWSRSRVRVGDEPAPEGETATERAGREARNQARREIEEAKETEFQNKVQNVLQGYASVGGQDRNKLLTEAIERMARDVQNDENDELEVEDFLAWVGELEVFAEGKALQDDPFWRETLSKIGDDMYARGKRMGKEGGDLTRADVAYKVRGPLLNILRGTNATTLEEALEVLNGGEGQQMVADELKRAGLDPGFQSTILSDEAQRYVDSRSQRSGRLDSTGKARLDELYLKLRTEGPTSALRAELLDPDTIQQLGGAGPDGQWGALWGAFESDEATDRRDSSYIDGVQMAMDSVISDDDLRLYPDAEAVGLRGLRAAARDKYNDALAAEPDPQKREALRRTLPKQIADEIKRSPEYQELISSSYDRQPELLLDASKRVGADLEAQVESYLPRTIQQDDGTGVMVTVRAAPENEGRRQAAKAQIRAQLVENTERLLRFYADEPDSRTRNAAIQQDLELGNREAGVKPMYRIVEDYFRTDVAPEPEAAPVTSDTNAIRVSRADERLEGLRLSRGSVDEARLGQLGGTVPPDMESEVVEAVEGGRMALGLLSFPNNPAFAEGLVSVHGTRVVGIASYRGGAVGGAVPQMTTTKRQLGKYYPSNNRLTRMYTSALLADPSGNLQPTDWWDNGDYVSDVGVDFNEMAMNPASLMGHLRFAVVQDGISFRELERGEIREGTSLEKIFGKKGDWPLDVMHIGPQAPAEFEAAFAEWANEDTRANSAYQKAMLSLGIFPDEPLADGSGATQGDKFMKILKSNYDTRREAMGDDLLKNIQRPYSSFSRMTAGERIYNDVARDGVLGAHKKAADGDYDNRIHSPAVRYVLEQEQRFLSDD